MEKDGECSTLLTARVPQCASDVGVALEERDFSGILAAAHSLNMH